MNTYIKKLFETIEFNNSNIFNTEDSYYEYDEKNTLIYRTIENKIQKGEAISEEEAICYFKVNKGIPEDILKKLINGEKFSKEIIKGISVNGFKYKVSSKEELREIIENYSEKNSEGSLNWIDVSNIMYMTKLFAFTMFDGDISEWDTSNVVDMSYMFYEAEVFNQDISNWDVSNVTDMSYMFCGAILFKQPIGKWNVSNVTDMGSMFIHAASFNQPIGDWNVSNVTDMNHMFYYATSFNQPIGDWNVSNVTNMDLMFYSATSFNQPIENWNVSNVRYMDNMFEQAKAFNQDISNWKLDNVESASDIFYKCQIKKNYKPKIKSKI